MAKKSKDDGEDGWKVAAGIAGGIAAGGLAAYLAGRSETVLVRCRCGAEYYASAQPEWKKTLSYCQYCHSLGMKEIIARAGKKRK